MKKIIKKCICKVLLPKGYSEYFSGKIIENFKNDFINNKNTTLKQKIWAYKRGFLSNKIELFKLNENNYKNYISDIDYYMLYPINGSYSKWIDDKLTTRYILQPYKKYLTKHYFQLDRDKIIKLMDCPINISNDIDGILKLLQQETSLAVKLLSGSLGEGFYKISYENNKFYINNKNVTKDETVSLIKSLSGYIVTEYLVCAKELARIYNVSPNTLRVLSIRDNNGEAKIIRSVARFGTSKSGVIEHAYAGGIYANIDVCTGRFSDGRSNLGLTKCNIHPDSKEVIEGYIPNWSLIKDKIIEMSNYIPQLQYMGWDVVVTDDGFKILEINSHQSLDLHQLYRGIYEDKEMKDFFENILSKYKYRRCKD